MRWVVLANIIAWPVAWYYSKGWLANFTYRINPGLVLYMIAGFSALMIAIMTVIFKAVKAARANPVDALKYE